MRKRIGEGLAVDVDKLRVIEGIACHPALPPGEPTPPERPFVPLVRVFVDNEPEIHHLAGEETPSREAALSIAHHVAASMIAAAVGHGASLKVITDGLAVRPNAVQRIDGLATKASADAPDWLPIARLLVAGGPEIHLPAGEPVATRYAAQELARQRADEVIATLKV
jgi:hypothetical protein